MPPVRGSSAQLIGGSGSAVVKLHSAPARKSSPPTASVAVTPTNVEITISRLSGSLFTEATANKSDGSMCSQKGSASVTPRERECRQEGGGHPATVKGKDINGAVSKPARSCQEPVTPPSSNGYSNLRSRVLRTLAAMKEGVTRDIGNTVAPSTRSDSSSSRSTDNSSHKDTGNCGMAQPKNAPCKTSSSTRNRSAPLPIQLPTHPTPDSGPPPVLHSPDAPSPAPSTASLDSLSSVSSTNFPSLRSFSSQESDLKILEKSYGKFATKQKNRGELLRNVVAEVICRQGSPSTAYSSSQELVGMRDVLLRWWSLLLSALPTVPCGDRGVYFDCILGIMERHEFEDFDYIPPPFHSPSLSHASSAASIATTTSTASMTLVDSDETKALSSTSAYGICGGDAVDSLGGAEGQRGLHSDEHSNEHTAERPVGNTEATTDTQSYTECTFVAGLAALKIKCPDITDVAHLPSSTFDLGKQRTTWPAISTCATVAHQVKSSKKVQGKVLRRRTSLLGLVIRGAATASKQNAVCGGASLDNRSRELSVDRSGWTRKFGQRRGIKYGASSWSLHGCSENDPDGENGFLADLDAIVSRYRHLLVDTLDYAINRLDQKGVFANVVTWSGRVLALSFLKIPGVAACLLQALPVSTDHVAAFAYAMAGKFGIPSSDAITVLERVLPAHTAPYIYRDLDSWCALFDNAHSDHDTHAEEKEFRTVEEDGLEMTVEFILPRAQKGGTGSLQDSSRREMCMWARWNRIGKPFRIAGNWVRRWQSDDSDLFHSFYQCYSRLLTEKLRKLRSFMPWSEFSGLASHMVLALPGHAHVASYVLGRAETLVLRRETMTVTQQTGGQCAGEGVPSQNCVLLENHSRRLAATMKTVECALGFFCPEDAFCTSGPDDVTRLDAVPALISSRCDDNLGSKDEPYVGAVAFSPYLARGSYKKGGICARGRRVFHGKFPFRSSTGPTSYPSGIMDAWVYHIVQKTNVHDVMSVFGLLDFLENMASVYIDRKSKLLGSYDGHNAPTPASYISPFHTNQTSHPQPKLDNNYVVSALGVLLRSEHSMVLLRTLHFIFRQFGLVVATPPSSFSSSAGGVVQSDGSLLMYPGILNSGIRQLCMDLLLDPALFEWLFCHWHRGVRNAFHRICLWRIGRLEERNALVSEPSEMVPTGCKGGLVGLSASNSANRTPNVHRADGSCSGSGFEAPAIAENEENAAICREKMLMTVPLPLARMRSVDHREILLTLEARLRDVRLSHEHHVTSRSCRSRDREIPFCKPDFAPSVCALEPCSAPTTTESLISKSVSNHAPPCSDDGSTSCHARNRTFCSSSSPMRDKTFCKWMFPSSQGFGGANPSKRLAGVTPSMSTMAITTGTAPAATVLTSSNPLLSLVTSNTSTPIIEADSISAAPTNEESMSPARLLPVTLDTEAVTRNAEFGTGKVATSASSKAAVEAELVSDTRRASGFSVVLPPCTASRLYPERMDVYAERSLEEYDQGFADYVLWINHLIATYPSSREASSLCSSPSASSSTPSLPSPTPAASPPFGSPEKAAPPAGSGSGKGKTALTAAASPTGEVSISAAAAPSTAQPKLSALGRKSSSAAAGCSGSSEMVGHRPQVIGSFPGDTEPRWLDMDEAWGGRWAFVNNAAINGGWARNAVPDTDTMKSA